MKHSKMYLIVFIFTAYGMLTLPANGETPGLRTKYDGKFYKVEILLDGEDVLTSPPEGLWSIATAWKQGWPEDWVHGKPTEIEYIGDWTILRGKLETPAGMWRISDSYRSEGSVIKCIRRLVKVRLLACPAYCIMVIRPVQRAAEYLFTQANLVKKPFLRNIDFRCPMPAWNGKAMVA
ncbi:MAG: hypothetical protein ACYS3N_17005 [Planctomycetota bacterium]|jgi:hypothetical protein